MSGTIALVGGDEFRVGCEDMDREVMRASGRHSPEKGNPASVIIIPTAAVTGPAKAANDGVTHFAALGGSASQLMVLESSHANDADFVASRSAMPMWSTSLAATRTTCWRRYEVLRCCGC